MLYWRQKSQLIIKQQAVGSAFIPAHKFKASFLEYYEEYVKFNKRKGNRYLSNSLKQFKAFIKSDFIFPYWNYRKFLQAFPAISFR